MTPQVRLPPLLLCVFAALLAQFERCVAAGDHALRRLPGCRESRSRTARCRDCTSDASDDSDVAVLSRLFAHVLL